MRILDRNPRRYPSPLLIVRIFLSLPMDWGMWLLRIERLNLPPKGRISD